MATAQPMAIKYTEPKIHRPKPKRINKNPNIFQYNKKILFYNKQIRTKNTKNNMNDFKKNNMKYFLNDDKSKNLSFNLDFISLEEIEKDFKEFKSKNEEIEVQRELIDLIKKSEHESCRNDCTNCHKIRRPEKPLYIYNKQ